MLTMRTILHPTDFSDLSQPAFEMSCALARDFGAELIICHVAPPAIIPAGEGMLIETPPEEADQLRVQLERMKPRGSEVRVTHHLLRGDPAGEILRLANEVDADVLVMGTHGRSGLGRLLLGSVAEEVMRKAPCPVVTVKSPLPVEAAQSPTPAPVTG